MKLKSYLFALLAIATMMTATSCEKDEQTTGQRKGRPHNPPPPSCGRLTPDPVLQGMSYSVSGGQYFNVQFWSVDSVTAYTLYVQSATIQPDGEIVDGTFYARASNAFGTPSIGVDMNNSIMDAGQTYTCRIKMTYAGTLCYKWSTVFIVATTEANSGERRGGNNQQPYTLIHTAPTNWNVTADTNACGTFILRWDAQPNAVQYYVNVIERPWNCAGSAVNTNQWYYTYGYGCSMLIAHDYNIQLSYFVKDDVNRITTYYYSDTTQVRTGSRGLWNCN